jgi:hypothetical protein
MRLTLVTLTFLMGGGLSVLTDAPHARAEGATDKLSVIQQEWRHEGKFLIVDITFQNDNPFPLKGVIISCDIKGDRAKPNDSRGMTIRQVLGPGRTKVPGLEFTITGTNAEGGPCKVTSAERHS